MIRLLPYIVAGIATGALGVSTRDMIVTLVAFGLAQIAAEAIKEGRS